MISSQKNTTKLQARASQKDLNSQLFRLNPSTLLTFFELDLSDLAFDRGLVAQIIKNPASITNDGLIYRFHNNLTFRLGDTIVWNKLHYISLPIKAEGFEITGKGVLPNPKISLGVDDGNPSAMSALTQLKHKIYLLDDLTGARLTRIRTFLKYLDADNFINKPVGSEIIDDYDGLVETWDAAYMAEFTPDPNAELPRDIYFIDRKSAETKNFIEFELSAAFDVEGAKLPSRLVSASQCMFQYRGQGCLYEADAVGELTPDEGPTSLRTASRRVANIHGEVGTSILPDTAPPVANIKDETIEKILKGLNYSGPIRDMGRYDSLKRYGLGNSVYIEKAGIKYYFVCKKDHPILYPPSPPNLEYWIADQCSKSVTGCRLRWKNIERKAMRNGVEVKFPKGALTFGGFPGTNRNVI